MVVTAPCEPPRQRCIKDLTTFVLHLLSARHLDALLVFQNPGLEVLEPHLLHANKQQSTQQAGIHHNPLLTATKDHNQGEGSLGSRLLLLNLRPDSTAPGLVLVALSG